MKQEKQSEKERIQQNTLANELLATNFKRSTNAVTQLSDPLVDTPMVVTLDELRPYELNPRVSKNPFYEDIKASIRERGLDAPPAITRRPGAEHYIIRNGGNTRLSILNELWKESRNERFFRVHCMFRPWQSEIVALTGHLAENELHGSLTFIEKALAIHRVKELYEEREQREISQRELAKLLTEDGFPINQSSVSRMGDAIHYLLPVIPTVLYSGFGKKPIEQLLGLMKSVRATWDKYAEKLCEDPELLDDSEELSFGIHGTFTDIWGEILHLFDTEAEKFDFPRFRDELIGRFSDIFECSYDQIALDILEKGRLQKVLTIPPGELPVLDEAELFAKSKKPVLVPDEAQIIQMELPKAPRKVPTVLDNPLAGIMHRHDEGVDEEDDEQEFDGVDSESPFLPTATGKLDVMQAMIASIAGEGALARDDEVSNYAMQVPRADGLFPVTNIWAIEPSMDDPEKLMVHMGQLVVEIAQELGVGHLVETCDVGLGYFIAEESSIDKTAQMVLSLFQALGSDMVAPTDVKFWLCLDSLMLGNNQSLNGVQRLSDEMLIKLFRVIRLGRRFYELNDLS